MTFIRRVRTASSATAVEVAEYVGRRRRILKHVGSARTEAELEALVERARDLLADPGQGMLDLGVDPTPAVADLMPPPGASPRSRSIRTMVVAAVVSGAGRVDATGSRLLFDALAGVYADLGFDVLGDETFRSLDDRADRGADLAAGFRTSPGRPRQGAGELLDVETHLEAVKTGKYRDPAAAACFAHARPAGDVALCLYDVTTLLCRRRPY